MKNLMMILAVMFAFTLTSFSQSNVIGNTTFLLYDGTTDFTDGFTVSLNPVYPDFPYAEGVMVITFDNIIDFTSVTNGNLISMTNQTEMSLDNGADYAIKFNYDQLVTGTVMINYNPNTVFTFLTEQDTVDAYNNGVASVDVDEYFNDGYDAGFNVGVASVDTQEYFDAGVASVDTSIYFYNGQLSINLDSIFEVGFLYGKSTDVVNIIEDASFSVYPNPVTEGEVVTVSTSSFTVNVDVYNTVGQLVHSVENNNTFSTSGFENGLYVLVVTDSDGNVITDADRKTAKIIVR